MLASMVFSAYGARQAAQQQKEAYKYNAEIGRQQAQDALDRGTQAVIRQRAKTQQLQGQQRAALAANGIDLGVGSALDILSGTDILGQQDADIIKQNAEREAWGYKSGAQLNDFYASSQNPNLAAATSLLSTGSQVASSWYTMSSVGSNTGSTGATPWPKQYTT